MKYIFLLTGWLFY